MKNISCCDGRYCLHKKFCKHYLSHLKTKNNKSGFTYLIINPDSICNGKCKSFMKADNYENT